MSCNSTNPCSNPCPTDCGCTVQVPGTCVFYQGAYLTCLDATKGDTYDSILQSINDIICDLQPPTGQTYTPGTGILITGNVISIDPTITTRITNTENNITALQGCVTQTVKNITSSSLNVTLAGQNSCGRTLNIEYVPPEIPLSQKQGIIDNVTENTSISSLTYTYDLTQYDLKVGDVLKIKGNVLTNDPSTTTNCSDIFIFLTDGSIPSIPFVLLTRGSDYCKIYQYIFSDFEFILSVTAVTPTQITFKTYYKNSRFVNIPPSVFGEDGEFKMIDAGDSRMYQRSLGTAFNKSSFKINFAGTANSTLRQYIVEIIRKIN